MLSALAFFCFGIAGWRVAPPQPATWVHPARWSNTRTQGGWPAPRLSADSGPVVAWSSEQRTPSLCDCYSFGRSCYARCFFSLFPGLSAPVVTDAFVIVCVVTRPGLGPFPSWNHPCIRRSPPISTTHGIPFVFSYRVVGALPSSSWCC